MITKTVSSVTPEATKVLAQFFLTDDKVIAAYHDAWFQKTIERGAVCTSSGQTLRPRDGQPFFDALDKAFASSSTTSVTTTKIGTRVDAIEINAGSLGVPRAEMPQIAAADVPEFLTWLKKQEVTVTEGVARAGDLKPTQAELNTDKVQGFVDANEREFLTRPIIVSRDGYVLDGHHRWAALKVLDPDAEIGTYRVGMQMRALLALAVTFGKSFTRTVHDGLDRLDAGESARVRALVDAAKERMRSALHPPKIEALAQKFAQQTSTFQRMQLARQTKAAFGVDVNPGGDKKVASTIDNFVQHNVHLITTIPTRLSDKIEGMVQHAVTSGSLSSDLGDQIKELGDSVEGQFKISEKHAKFIARDQTGKLLSGITRIRHQSLGITRFIWRTSEDERVRGDPNGLYPKAEPSHFDLDGNEYDYDDPPTPDGADGPLLPGDDWQCRCQQEPVIDGDLFGDGEDDQGDEGDQPDTTDQPDDTGDDTSDDEDFTDLVDE